MRTEPGLIPVNKLLAVRGTLAAGAVNKLRESNAASREAVSVTPSKLPEILMITSYSPRECGIATYSDDLIKMLNRKFSKSFAIHICPLESDNEIHTYSEDIVDRLNTDEPGSFNRLARSINGNSAIKMVMIQHEFGFFAKCEEDFIQFLNDVTKPVIMVFHTVLPGPNALLKINVQNIAAAAVSVVVMTESSANILAEEYGIANEKITIIPHGTHLIPHADKENLKSSYNLSGKRVLSTFGLLSSGKSIETTLDALPAIIKEYPDVMFLVIGKTHPSVVKHEGEKYRELLNGKVEALHLREHVTFINRFLPLEELLEYLQLTDIYLFTSKDPNQAVSGTFSYAVSSGCPIISTPIPHAREVVKNDAGIIFDFENAEQLSLAVINLLADEKLRSNISLNGLHRMASTAWENAAISHARLFSMISGNEIELQYSLPPINLAHVKGLTTDFGIIQFSEINKPDINSGYTLDDNARALIAMCKHFELTLDKADVAYIRIYLNFIKHCIQPKGYFLNYVNIDKEFTAQNDTTNLADSNGRAIWALGYLISMGDLLPADLALDAQAIMQKALPQVYSTYSTRAMAFVIKGLYYSNTPKYIALITELADRMVQMFRHEADNEWHWFESYLTYANSVLPEALLCAWLATGKLAYKEIARLSFDFLLSKTFDGDTIKVVSNKSWLHKGNKLPDTGGEQPIDVAYTILALSKFYNIFRDREYMHKMETAFSWFLGNNHLNQVVYNPGTGGCYDGLENKSVNLNQGAESTVSYLLARLTIIELKQLRYEKNVTANDTLFKINYAQQVNSLHQ